MKYPRYTGLYLIVTTESFFKIVKQTDSGVGLHMQMSPEIVLNVSSVLSSMQLDFLIDAQTTDT